MTDCAVGGDPIVGVEWRVRVAAHPDPVPMCETHGRVVECGLALSDLLGHDAPTVARFLEAIAPIVDEPCPAVLVVPPQLDNEGRRLLDRMFTNGFTLGGLCT
jgi:hypothetical protein